MIHPTTTSPGPGARGNADLYDFIGVMAAARVRARAGTRVAKSPGTMNATLLPSSCSIERLPVRTTLVGSSRIALDGSWFDVDGVHGDIARRPVLRRVLAALATHHATGVNQPLTMHDVLAAGWPDEHCVGDSGATRVYQTIKRLRQLGLGALLHHDGRGYWLRSAPATEGRRATAA